MEKLNSYYHANFLMILSGAGGEIGGGTAVETAKWGANLALIDIHEGRLQETMEKLTSMGVNQERVRVSYTHNGFSLWTSQYS